MNLYESFKKSLKESKNDPILQEIYDNLQAGISYGEDMDKEHHSWITYPYFDAVLYRIENDGRGEPCIGWRHYGSSANPNTIEDLNWIITTIFEMTPEEFVQKYIKNTESKLEESCNKKELKEMDNSDGLTNIQFVEYCKGKLADLGTVKVKNFDDEEVDVKVAFEQPIRDYGMCKVLDGEDTMDKLDSDGETLEFVDEKGEYHNSPMISPITLVGRCEFDKIDNKFYKFIIQYWDEISDFFESEKLKEGDASDEEVEKSKKKSTKESKKLNESKLSYSEIFDLNQKELYNYDERGKITQEIRKIWDKYYKDGSWCRMAFDSFSFGDPSGYRHYVIRAADETKNKLYYRNNKQDDSLEQFKKEARACLRKYGFDNIKFKIIYKSSASSAWDTKVEYLYAIYCDAVTTNKTEFLDNNISESEKEADNMNTTTSFIDIKEIIKYAENYLMEKLNATVSIGVRPDGQYRLTIPNTDKTVADYLKLHNDLHLWEAEKLNEANLGYNDKLGGDPEDYISDIQSIKDKLNELDTNKFATKLAYAVWEQFDDTCDYQIQSTKDRFLNESYNYIGKDTGEAGRDDKSHMEHIYTVYDCFGEVDTFKSKEDAEKYIEEHKDDEMYTEEYGCSNGPEFRIDEDDIEVNNKKIVVKDDLAESEKVKESEKTLAVNSWTFSQ
jgi:hypothetical protein